jgi:tRNA pseudouridine38-40 synthase
MAEAGALLIGRHDFTTFRATKCQAASPIKTLDVLTVTRRDQLVEIEVASRSFLHNQVRSIAGSLRLVGEGKWSVDDMAEALAAKDRRACGPVAPAHGLYLTQVDY